MGCLIILLVNIYFMSTATVAVSTSSADSSASATYSFTAGNGSGEEITADCPEDEQFSNCTQALCRRWDCNQQGQNVTCIDVNDNTCESGCVCQPGLLRTADGSCVPESQCYGDLVCQDSEVVNTCSKGCVDDFCPLMLHQSDDARCCPEERTDECGKPVCTCRFNYKRDNYNNTCIPTRYCPPFACYGKNEEYHSCPPLCPTDDCNQATPTGRCPLPGRIGIVLQCKPTCRCIPGYWRKNGVCVPYAECPQFKKCGVNEVLVECPNACAPISCPTSYKAEQDKQKNCVSTAICNPSECRCKPNYRRSENGTCIPIGNCPGICPVNEEFSTCVQGLCCAQNCTQLGRPVACASIAEGSCISGCVCKAGTLRNKQGKCVPEKQCKKAQIKKCLVNEVLVECPNACAPISCPTSYKAEQDKLKNCVSTAICNPSECRCKPNYRRSENGTCIPIGNCPGICPVKEEFSTCVQGLCRAQNCTQLGRPVACSSIAEGSCISGCVCKAGTLRNKQGKCVCKKQCKKELPQCGRNEVLSCVQECPPQKTCRTRNIQYSCLQSVQPCQMKCICKPGHFRNAKGDCITAKQCDQCQRLNEFYDCGTACDNVCSDSTQNRTNCPIVNIVCNPRCYCEDGFARNSKEECVPIDECPKTEMCGTNEELMAPKRVCPPDHCISLVARFKCRPEEETDESGCACKPGYLRINQNSTCIPICQCPQMANSQDCVVKDK